MHVCGGETVEKKNMSTGNRISSSQLSEFPPTNSETLQNWVLVLELSQLQSACILRSRISRENLEEASLLPVTRPCSIVKLIHTN